MDFTILNWNIGGAKFLEDPPHKRPETKLKLNEDLLTLINDYKRPHVVTLQEIVRYENRSGNITDLIKPIDGYSLHQIELINSKSLSNKTKWKKVEKNGEWSPGTYFGQGNAMLVRKDIPHFPVWDLSFNADRHPINDPHLIEKVNLESGLYFGDRDTEPRAILVAHFIFNPIQGNHKPLDIFVLNVHLTTLTREREGIPEIDLKASSMRQVQLDVIFKGIVSRYNNWRRLGYPEREKVRPQAHWETYDRFEPVWIVVGDFNFTPESVEYESIQRMNFMDMVPHKGTGTKAKGVGQPATLTLDYIFAGPKFISLDPLLMEKTIHENKVVQNGKGSDHYPIYAHIHLKLPGED